MIRIILCAGAVALLAGCQPPVPDSGAGVGFDRLDRDRLAAQERDAQLAGQTSADPSQTSPTTVLPPSETRLKTQVAQPPAIDPENQADALARAQNSGQAPVQASPSNPVPAAVTNSAGISQEQDFDAVSNRRSIEGDAERLEAARAQYVVIEPSALPTRPGSNVPNIVEYAIRTNNPVGTRIYQRSGFNAARKFERNCAEFASEDIAQEEFLMSGGPQRDRQGLDPDGDGFACFWDPRPYRRAVSNARGG